MDRSAWRDNHLQDPSKFFLELVAYIRSAALLGCKRQKLERFRTQTDLWYGGRDDVNGDRSRSHQDLSDHPSPTRRHDFCVARSNLALDHAVAVN